MGRDKNENPVKTDFINLDQTLGSLIPSGSLLTTLKHSTILEKFSRHQSNSRHPIRFKV